MPQARDEAGNIWETDEQGNPVRLLQPAAALGRQATIIANPYKQRDEARKDEDQGFQREQVGISARSVANSERATSLAEQRFQAEEAARAREEERRRNPAITAAQRLELESKRGTLANLASGIASLKTQYDTNFKGRSAAEYLPSIARPENGVFNDKSGSLSAYVAAALGLSGQQFNTPAEQQLFIGSILPKAGDTDQQIEAKLGTLTELLRNADNTSASQLGVNPAYQGDNLPPPPPGNGDTPPPSTRGYENDPTGGRTFQTELDRTYQNEVETAFKAGATRQQLDAIAAKYGAPAFGPELDQAIQARALNPNAPVGFTTPASGREEAGLTGALLGPMAGGNVGSYFAGAGNAVTAGNLGRIAELTGSSDGGADLAMQMARDNGGAYFGGELTGGVLGALGTQGILGKVAGRMAPGAAANILASPLTADTLYGAATGASTADDPLYGAIGGAALGAGGSYVGQRIGQGLFGLGKPKGVDPLNRGERDVLGAVNATGASDIEAALLQAQELGVPAALADVSPEAQALAGSAIRANPTVAGQARQTLQQRSRGQIDRFRQAVGRDLGPVENIPQRSEDLIAQAKTAAGPLYDAAYAAPGATVLDIADILARPSAQSALGRAGRLAAEEGRDPNALGFQFDDVGNAVAIESPTWQTIDYLKRGLDDVVQSNRSGNMGRLDTEGRAVNDTLAQLLARTDEMNPDYAAARAAYAGPMQERGFLEAGQKAVRANPNQLGVDMAGLTPQRADQMRMGFTSQVVDDAERLRMSGNPFSALDTPAMEQRLGTVFNDPEAIARLLAQRDLEGQLSASTNRLVGNSMTAERMAGDAAFNDEGVMRPMIEAGAETAITGAPVMTILRNLANSGLGQRLTAGSRARAATRAEQVAPLTLNTNPEDTIAQILALAQKEADYKAAKAAMARRGSRPGALVGTGAATGLLPYMGGQ